MNDVEKIEVMQEFLHSNRTLTLLINSGILKKRDARMLYAGDTIISAFQQTLVAMNNENYEKLIELYSLYKLTIYAEKVDISGLLALIQEAHTEVLHSVSEAIRIEMAMEPSKDVIVNMLRVFILISRIPYKKRPTITRD